MDLALFAEALHPLLNAFASNTCNNLVVDADFNRTKLTIRVRLGKKIIVKWVNYNLFPVDVELAEVLQHQMSQLMTRLAQYFPQFAYVRETRRGQVLILDRTCLVPRRVWIPYEMWIQGAQLPPLRVKTGFTISRE